jgi:5'-methylthioadenosine phosphorylase
MEPAFDERTRQILLSTARELGTEGLHEKGTVITIEGPRFSSKAESLMFKQWGADLINMSTCPEVTLAKEAGILYGSIAMATDYDCWKDDRIVCVTDVLAMFKQNVEKVTKILLAAVPNIAKEDWIDTVNDLKNTVNSSVMVPHST